MVASWKAFKNAGLDNLAKNPVQLQKFDDLVKSNNLGLDTKGLEDLLTSPKGSGLHGDVIKYLLHNNLLSIESFSTQFVERSCRDYSTLWVFREGGLTADIPARYNERSKDYINKGRAL